jgi:heat shock protein HslJ
MNLFFSCDKKAADVQLPPADKTAFYDTLWILKSLKGNTVTVKSWTIPYITFSKATKIASGKSPCNTFGGSFVCDYKTGGVAFDMETISTTKVYCGDDALLETDFYQMLRDADFAKVIDNKLFMYKNNIELAVFERYSCTEKAASDRACITLYDPVCGCNNKTYGNACEAEARGIFMYIKGECAK